MKLPKTRPWRQDVHGELLVGILLGPSAHGPGHADLAFPVGLEPLQEQQASQATDQQSHQQSQPRCRCKHRTR